MKLEREDYKRFLSDLLACRPVAYWPVLARKLGGVKQAVFLSQLLYWSGSETAQNRDGWFWKTVEEIEEETGLSKSEQQTARAALAKSGVIEAALKGIPPRWWYKVNMGRLHEILTAGESAPSGAADALADEPDAGAPSDEDVAPSGRNPAQQRTRFLPNNGQDSCPTTDRKPSRYSYITTDITQENTPGDYNKGERCSASRPSDNPSDSVILNLKEIVGSKPPREIREEVISAWQKKRALFIRGLDYSENEVDAALLAKAKSAFEEWVGSGFNPKNWRGWFFDWFIAGIRRNGRKPARGMRLVADQTGEIFEVEAPL